MPIVPLVSKFIPPWADEYIKRSCELVWPTTNKVEANSESESDSSQDLSADENDEKSASTDQGPTQTTLVSSLPLIFRFPPQNGLLSWPGDYVAKAYHRVRPFVKNRNNDAREDDEHDVDQKKETDKKNITLLTQNYSVRSEETDYRLRFTLWPMDYLTMVRDYVRSFSGKPELEPATITAKYSTGEVLQEPRDNWASIDQERQVKILTQEDLALVPKSTKTNWFVSLPGEYVSWICDHVCQPFGNSTQEPEDEQQIVANEPVQEKLDKDVNVAFLTFFAGTFMIVFPIVFCASFMIFFLTSFGVAFLITFSFSLILALTSAMAFSLVIPAYQIPPGLLVYFHPQWWLDHVWQLVNEISIYSILTSHLIYPRFLQKNPLIYVLPSRFRPA
ncbi:hypothetical protein FBUS_02063 [Fasciolopsis buskii]|uniref:Transmembrane protein n=1 Tax=Fasciolopsis buskii TaxID=27845 RepID=A0A8E0RTS1_9TREM|nr:hypothetical protein FBUS_02063 [Fasciolopsis buski]